MTRSLAAVPSSREILEAVQTAAILGADAARRYRLLEDAAYSAHPSEVRSGDPESSAVAALAIDGLNEDTDKRQGPRAQLEHAADCIRKAETAMREAREALIAAERVERRRSAVGRYGTWEHGDALDAAASWETDVPGAGVRAAKVRRARNGQNGQSG